jgi:hypothetical protein
LGLVSLRALVVGFLDFLRFPLTAISHPLPTHREYMAIRFLN